MKFNAWTTYRQFVLKNTSQISLIESTLRSISYLLPSSFSNAHLASEALYVLVNLVSLVHDSILYDAFKKGELAPLPNSTTKNILNQFLRSIHEHSPTLHSLNIILTFLQSSEHVLELIALSLSSSSSSSSSSIINNDSKKTSTAKGIKTPWTLILCIELIKASIRAHFVLTTQALTVQPNLPERDLHPNLIETYPYRGSRTGLMFSNATTSPLFLPLTKTFTSPNYLVTKLKNHRLVGELIFIFRPVIYVALLKKYGKQRWFPFITSLMLEFVAYFLSTDVTPTPLEKREYQRRAHLFLYYFLRAPFYDKLTKPVLDKILSSLDAKPILKSVAKLVRDYQPFWEKMYFHTSGS